MFHQQRSQAGHLAQRKNLFFPEISSPNDDQAIQILSYIVNDQTRAWLINKTVGNVTGPSPRKALFPFSLCKLLLNAKILCALPYNSTPSNAKHSFNKSFHSPKPWT